MFQVFPFSVKFFTTLQKNRSHNLLMLEQKQGYYWNMHKILIRVIERYLQILFKSFFLLEVKYQKMIILENNYSIIRKSPLIEKMRQKFKISLY